MELKGTVIEILPEQTGQGKNGPWRKNRFILEIPGNYPKKVAIDVWGDKFDDFAIAVNQELTVGIEIESRQWQDKWFTDVKAWKVTKEGNSASAPTVAAPLPDNPAPSSDPFTSSPPDNSSVPAGKEPDYDDDLPF